MATDLFVPQIWNTKIQRVNEDNLVAKKICNMEAEGQVKQAGDTVYFNGLADPTVSAYTGTVTYETLQNAGVVMAIDQQQYFAFKVNDVQKAQANVDLKGSQASRAAYKMSASADSYVLGLYAQALRSITDTTLDSATVISVMGKAQQYLAEVNVQANDMWMVIPPWVKLKLQLAGIKFLINEGINGTGGMAWTKELGFDMFVTNQVTNTNTVAAPVSECMAGSYNAIAYADQIINTESMRLEGSFDTAVRGLHVYGAKVVRPDHLVRMTLTWVDETAI